MKHWVDSWKCDYFWRTSRGFIWWWNTVSNAWYYFSNKTVLAGEIKDRNEQFFIWTSISFVFSLWIINEFEKVRQSYDIFWHVFKKFAYTFEGLAEPIILVFAWFLIIFSKACLSKLSKKISGFCKNHFKKGIEWRGSGIVILTYSCGWFHWNW